jgi:hypothetical protein
MRPAEIREVQRPRASDSAIEIGRTEWEIRNPDHVFLALEHGNANGRFVILLTGTGTTDNKGLSLPKLSWGLGRQKSAPIGRFRHDLGKEMCKEMSKENFRVFSPTTSNSSTKILNYETERIGQRQRQGSDDMDASDMPSQGF